MNNATVQRLSLRGNRDFLAVLGSQSVSGLGDAISLTAMPLLVLSLTGSGAMMAVVAALQVLPDLVLGLPAGAMADRWDRRRMMMWTDLGQAGLTALIPLSFWLGLPTMAVILLVVLPVHSLRVFGTAGFTSVMPDLVGRDNLGRANGYLEAAVSGSFILGPAMAGLLVSTIGPASTLAIDAASFAVSAGWLATVRRPLRADRSGEQLRILADIREGIRFVWHRPVLRSIIGYWGIMAIATAALMPTLAYFIVVDLRLGPEFFGFLGSAWSLGYLAGSLLGGRGSSAGSGGRMVTGGAVVGACLVAIAVTPEPLICLVVGFVLGAGLGVLLVSYMTLRARLTPDRLLGRVGSTARTLTLGLQPVGLLAGGALLHASTGAHTLAAMGCVAILASLVFGRSGRLRSSVEPNS